MMMRDNLDLVGKKRRMKLFNMDTLSSMQILPNSILLLLYFVLLLLYFYVTPPLEDHAPSGRAIRQLIFGLDSGGSPSATRAIATFGSQSYRSLFEIPLRLRLRAPLFDRVPSAIRAILRLRLSEHLSSGFLLFFSHLRVFTFL